MKLFKQNIIKTAVKIIISFALIYTILRFIGVNKVFSEIINADPFFVFISLLLTILLVVLKAVRWRNVVHTFNIKLGLMDSIKFTIMSLSFSIITPAKIGEFIKAKYLVDKTQSHYMRSFVTVLIDKGFDVTAMAFLALLGTSFLKEFAQWHGILIAIFFAYLGMLAIFFCFFWKALRIIFHFAPRKYKDSISKVKFTRQFFLISILLSLGIWLVLSFQAFFILKSLAVPASLLITISVVPLMALSSLAPFSFGGIGIREVIAISFLLALGISPEKSTVFSLLYTFMGAGVPAIIGGFMHFFRKNLI